ncbi:MAG: signal peptidase II [Acidobacteria bacterium]|nr:MAG: signal peptidase II [Acidobacteriota bacterium]
MSEALVARVRNISRVIYAAIALLVFVGDQSTKAIVESSIPERQIIPVIPGLFNITHVKNEGAAFGLFADSPAPWKTVLLIVISAALLATVVGVVWKTRRLHWEAGVGLSLILGGALSNLVDRIRMGRVVDFLDFYFRSYHWYTFNLADSAIVVGAGFLILQVLFVE